MPDADEVVVMTRPLGDAEPPPVGPIPVEGMWKLPDTLPPWRPTPLSEDHFDPLLACPHCGQEAERYKRLTDGYNVCLQCGRSFKLT